jgi:hypothetical protein
MFQNFYHTFELEDAGGDGKATWTQNTYYYSNRTKTVNMDIEDIDDDFVIYKCEKNGWNQDDCWGTFDEDNSGWIGTDGSNSVNDREGAIYDEGDSPNFQVDKGWNDLRFMHWENTGNAYLRWKFVAEDGDTKKYTDIFHAVNYGQPLDQIGPENTTATCTDGIDNDGDYAPTVQNPSVNLSWYRQNPVDVQVGQNTDPYQVGRQEDGLPDFGETGVDLGDEDCEGVRGPEITIRNASNPWWEIYEKGLVDSQTLTGNISNPEDGEYNSSSGTLKSYCFDKYDNDFDGQLDYFDEDCRAIGDSAEPIPDAVKIRPRVYYHLGVEHFSNSNPKADAVCNAGPDQKHRADITNQFLCTNYDVIENTITPSNQYRFINASNAEGRIVPTPEAGKSFVALEGEWQVCSQNNNSLSNPYYSCTEFADSHRIRQCCAGGSCANHAADSNKDFETDPTNITGTPLGSLAAYEGGYFSGLTPAGIGNTQVTLFDGSGTFEPQRTMSSYDLPASGTFHLIFQTTDDTRIPSPDDDTVTITDGTNDIEANIGDQTKHNATTGTYHLQYNLSQASLDELTNVTFTIDSQTSPTLTITQLGVTQDTDAEPICSTSGWIPGFDGDNDQGTAGNNSGAACQATFGANANNDELNRCCGDDIDVSNGYAERWGNGTNGCWFGQPMTTGTLLSDRTSNTEDSTILYNESFYTCNAERQDPNMSYAQATTQGALFNAVQNYTTVGNHICQPSGWAETLDGGELFRMAGALQNYTGQVGTDDYSLLCGNLRQVINQPTNGQIDPNPAACALRIGENEAIQTDDSDEQQTILLMRASPSDSADIDVIEDVLSLDPYFAGHSFNASLCPSSNEDSLSLYHCNDGGEQNRYPTLLNSPNTESVHFYADNASGYVAITSHVIDDGIFQDTGWSLTNNPITDFFSVIIDNVTGIFTTGDEIPYDADTTARGLYLAQAENYTAASSLYDSTGGQPALLRARYDDNGGTFLFNETDAYVTMQRHYSDINPENIDGSQERLNVTTSVQASSTADMVSLWKQLVVTTQ